MGEGGVKWKCQLTPPEARTTWVRLTAQDLLCRFSLWHSLQKGTPEQPAPTHTAPQKPTRKENSEAKTHLRLRNPSCVLIKVDRAHLDVLHNPRDD